MEEATKLNFIILLFVIGHPDYHAHHVAYDIHCFHAFLDLTRPALGSRFVSLFFATAREHGKRRVMLLVCAVRLD